ncbi:hypothetical protein [Advenella sp. FME57]|uniref:hypothetical protein n=1 Tax=Advenella sp. FME57 TaxID=2742604 RepID=UPI001867A1CA|nr:hypothetical protein [Advenella sp. FME57]
MRITNDIPATIAGSAMAGFGFSLGRDTYKRTKKASKDGAFALFLIGMVIVGLMLTQYSMMWFFRNYQSFVAMILMRVVALISYTAGIAISGIFFWMIGFWIGELLFDKPNGFIEMLSGLAGPAFQASDPPSQFATIFAFGILVFLTVSGVITGVKQRAARLKAWAAEEHNRQFMKEHQLFETKEGYISDPEGNIFEEKFRDSDSVMFLAKGRRNKRALLKFDESGKFTVWTGMLSIAPQGNKRLSNTR